MSKKTKNMLKNLFDYGVIIFIPVLLKNGYFEFWDTMGLLAITTYHLITFTNRNI